MGVSVTETDEVLQAGGIVTGALLLCAASSGIVAARCRLGYGGDGEGTRRFGVSDGGVLLMGALWSDSMVGSVRFSPTPSRPGRRRG
ncbi:MAG: hypothetical protein H0W21_07705 [Actinobacteria bacterium]|nr:hypothetical protein [Actinomycetota bacterium]